ncbi:SMI1/KNR4 family protein [Chryseobacterium camelliae]|uniref:SMI1/KNR4 family protein n=1 Tax=Chryseobacterium camelliae TaxID=1265445 RepID=A0ABU0TKP3_9FLAO|nr:SMI1/KNR4 family protein [Chryseobacterium camelliae]MDQ1097620.1 hypothetical protein [Chryseobacterium camelliae]
MNPIADQYIAGLKQAYFDHHGGEAWDHFEKIKHGLSDTNIQELKRIYPEIPDALISLLEYADGTYRRQYAGERMTFYFLGSDVEEYPYYLLPSDKIIENRNLAVKFYAGYINREYEEVEIDNRIAERADALNWLHFSDCMNGGGSSQLFIDFSPSEKRDLWPDRTVPA